MRGLGLTLLGLGAGAAPARAAATVLEVAYIPILAMAQLFIIQGEGWAKQAGLDLKLTRFSSGPAMVQALASGRFDIAYIGIGPAVVAAAHGVDIKVLAGNGIGQGGLLGRGRFAADFPKSPNAAAAFAAFHKAAGRPVRLATLPKGSGPDTTLRYYLFEVAHVAPGDVTLLGMGAEQMQQALLSGAVDGASVLDPIPAVVQSRDPSAHVLVDGQTMFPGAPGAVIAARGSALAAHGDAITRLVALHIRATALIRSDPARAARDITAGIGAGLVPQAIIEASLRGEISTFVADPHPQIGPTRKMQTYQMRIGAQDKAVDVGTLFDTAVYDRALAMK
ncbi:MAG: ABC transporter substrate-binding protein [Rhodospirillales bacterium]|nr:ABC transporter substrate-binding protein [Rhodospirillales bacterium]